jgi:hypothetical protein
MKCGSLEAVPFHSTVEQSGIVTRPPLKNNEDHDLVEVAKGVVDQFRETLPLLDLNLTEHAENPRG